MAIHNIKIRKKNGAEWDTLYPLTLANNVTTNNGKTVQYELDTMFNKTATTNKNGAMSSADKTKLDGIETNANKYIHPTTPGNKHIPSGGSAGQVLKWSENGTAVWSSDSAAHTHDKTYLKLSGGTMTGEIQMSNNAIRLTNEKGSYARIGYEASTGDVYISNANNNWLRIKSDRTITIGGQKVYTALDKPTPADIGASATDHNHDSNYLKLSGGTITGQLEAIGNLKTSKYLQIGALENYGTGTLSLWFNNKDGAGVLTSEELKNIKLGSNYVYHTGNKPTPVDIGALPLTGGSLTGSLKINSNNPTLTIAGGEAKGTQGRIAFTSDSPQGVQLRYNSYDVEQAPFGLHIEKTPENEQRENKAYLKVEGSIYSGATINASGKVVSPNLYATDSGKQVRVYVPNSSYAWIDTDATYGLYSNQDLYIKGEIYAGSGYNNRVYHTGNKPSANDIGILTKVNNTSYWGLAVNGSEDTYIRTPKLGLIPNVSNGASGNGGSILGTTTWRFANVWTTHINDISVANLYHTWNKPEPSDIGAAEANHNHNKIITSNNGGVYEGNGDAASSTRANVQIKSWYGIGFAPSISGQNVPQNQNAVWINCRTGELSARGPIWSGANIKSESYISTPILVGNKIQGRDSANRFYTGEGSCRIDTNDNYFRIHTSAVGTNDYGLRISPYGGGVILVNNVIKHAFNADGSKTGGSIEIEGISYGMSPIDSPKFLIEDILFDIDIDKDGTIVELNNIFAKSIDGKYGVFVNNGQAVVSDKNFDNFKVSGYTGKVDIRVVGTRIGYEEDYYKILGGFEHGAKEEISN